MIVVLFLLLGNIRAALITSLAIPLSMLIAATGMVQGKISGNLMSLGAIDFGLIVDGVVVTVENALRRLSERQRALGRRLELGERLTEVRDAAIEVIKPAAFGQAIIITVYLPILFLTGVEGKMFRPMAITVILALVGAFILSMTFIPATIALGIGGNVQEKENILIRWAKTIYAPLLRWAVRLRYPVALAAVALFAAAVWLFTTLGSEFVPKLDEGDIALQPAMQYSWMLQHLIARVSSPSGRWQTFISAKEPIRSAAKTVSDVLWSAPMCAAGIWAPTWPRLSGALPTAPRFPPGTGWTGVVSSRTSSQRKSVY